MGKIVLSFIIFSKLLFCQEKIFNYISIGGGEIENAVLPYSSTTVLFAFNLRSLWKGYVDSNGDVTWQETEFKSKYGTGPQYIAVHPSNPDIILAWIDYPDPSGQPNRGLVRSEDGGKTWEKIESIDPNFVPAGRVREGISPIVFSIKEPDRVYLFGNLWSTYDRPIEEKIVLYKSTDAGKTFTEIIPFPNYAPPNYTPLSIGVTYTDESGDDVIYIGLQGVEEPKFFKSIDTAGTWSELTIPNYNNDKGDISFISLSTTNSVAVHAGRITRTYNKIYVSTDGWKTYSEITLDGSYKIREFSPVVISPDGKRVYFPADEVDGNNINAVKIFVSTFNGTNWENPTVFFDGKVDGVIKGFDFRNILINPDDQNEFYFVDNLIHGIVKRKNNENNGDVSFQNNNLEGASIVSGTKDKDGKLYVITKGAIYKNDGSSWSRIHEDMLPLEWMKIITHPDTGKVYAIGFGTRTFYYDDTNQKWKLPDNTETSRFVNFDENYYTSGAPLYGTSDLVFDKTNNRLYFGVFKNYPVGSIEGLYVVKFKNTDEIDKIEKINGITGSVHSVAISYDNPSVLFIGKGEQVYWDFQPDGLYKIELDDNDNIISSKKLLDNVVPYKIFIDNSNSNILYAACYENKMPAGPRYTRSYGPLYVSYDGGETWNKAGVLGNYDEPTKGIENVIDIKVSSTGVIYVANRDHDTGFTHLYYSLNNGISFNRYIENIGEIKTLMLGSLYVGTNVGLWKANKEPQPLTYDISKPKLYSYPNPFKPSHGYTVLKYFVPQGKTAKSVKISIYNIAGELVYEYKEDRELPGGYAYYYQWDGRNKEGKLCASGVYIAVVKSNLDTVKTKIVLIR